MYIFLEPSKDTELEKYLLGKTQNSNESFNDTVLASIPKNTFVTLPCLKFGVCDRVAH